MFLETLEGTLMEVAEAPDTRFRYVIWFDYTRQAVNQIQEGTLVAAPNFGSDKNVRRFSVLEVVAVLPTHYALVGGTNGYPGFVVEAARSASEDWEAQDSEATEDTTKIRVVAIPTNLEIVEPLSGEPSIDSESNIAMAGSQVRLLDSEYTNLIANSGIDVENEKNLTTIGTMARDDKVSIFLRIDELYRTHFAVFGFTGVGKSNLLSTIVSKVLTDANEPMKLVFFDLMSEYTVLLLDQLLSTSVKGRIVTLGRHTLPEGLFKYINQMSGAPDLSSASKQLERYVLLPKALVRDRQSVAAGLRDLIAESRIAYYEEAQSLTIWDLCFTDETPWGKARKAELGSKRRELLKSALKQAVRGQDYKETVFTPAIAKALRTAIETALQAESQFVEDFEPLIAKLGELESITGEPHAAGVTLQQIVDDLNDPSHSSLWIIQAHDPNHLRRFSKQLGETVYEKRRLGGIIDPLVSFIFDEADEFIRSDAKGSYVDSATIGETLARRGRKFGLGIGIATQRIRYLDTNIMSQPHTYFISKLPRLSDRQAVTEAFGVGEELLNQTFKFKKGQWLLMSHDATGLEAVPIPIRTPDANIRLASWLRDRYPRLERKEAARSSR